MGIFHPPHPYKTENRSLILQGRRVCAKPCHSSQMEGVPPVAMEAAPRDHRRGDEVMSSRVCWIATAFVVTCLTAGTAQAWAPAQIRPALAAPEAGGVVAAAWSWLASLFRSEEPSPVRRI